MTAIGALRACRELGVQVPDEFPLLELTIIPNVRYVQPKISSIHVPLDEMGKMAVRTLADESMAVTNCPLKLACPTISSNAPVACPAPDLPETCRRNWAQHISPLRRIYMPRENHCGECCCLKGNIEERACQLALYIIENKATVRSAAQRFGISKYYPYGSDKLERLIWAIE